MAAIGTALRKGTRTKKSALRNVPRRHHRATWWAGDVLDAALTLPMAQSFDGVLPTRICRSVCE
jgi:hypothetical protein